MNTKVIAAALLGASGLLAQVPAAKADATPTTTITSVWQYAGNTQLAGKTFITVAGGNCTPTGFNTAMFVIAGNEAKQEQLLSLALAARLSGRNVVITFDSPTNCNVVSIRLL